MPNHYGLEGLSVPVGLIVHTNCFIEEDDNAKNESEEIMRTIPDDRMDSMYSNVLALKRIRNKTRKKYSPKKKKRSIKK